MPENTALITQTPGTLTGRQADGRPVRAYLSNLAPGSRRTMAQSLATLADALLDREPAAVLKARGEITDAAAENERRVYEFAWERLRYEHTAAIRARLVELTTPSKEGGPPSLSVSTANKSLNALRRILREAWKLQLISQEDFERAAAIEGIKGGRIEKGRALSATEMLKLAVSCEEDETPLGARDGAIVALLCGAGLRRESAVCLKVSDWDREAGLITVRTAKGNEPYKALLAAGADLAIARWLDARAALLAKAGKESDCLLLGFTRGHNIRPEGLTADAIFKALIERAKKAGVATFAPHDLRRTFITTVIETTGDVGIAQKLANHKQITTTTRYDKRGEESKRAAMAKIKIPFTSKPANKS